MRYIWFAFFIMFSFFDYMTESSAHLLQMEYAVSALISLAAASIIIAIEDKK